jgi:hypothetical protein
MRVSARDIFAALAFALILLGGLRPELFVLVFADREPLRRELATAADRASPGYPAFLQEISKQTRPSEPIALLFRPTRGDAPAWYAYFRARYFLIDRVVLPVVDIDGVTHPEYLGRARYVAAWGVRFENAQFETLWRGSGGELLRRRP